MKNPSLPNDGPFYECGVGVPLSERSVYGV